MNTIFDLQRYALQVLKDIYDENEVRVLCSLIFQHVLKCTNIEIQLKKHEQLKKRFADIFLQILERLKENEPLQYILGETEFDGLTFQLNASTLIPRPETEELVVWIMESGITSGKRVLDIGTGSGCIAISLANRVPGLKITGVDISPEAVEQADGNAERNGVEVEFLVRDILHPDKWEWETYDIIVSNPPYVRWSERAFMHERVLGYEPAQALFVSDEDPLIFYRAIAEFAKSHLVPGGLLFFEINEALGPQTVALLASLGYQDIVLRQDLNTKNRFTRSLLSRPKL